MSSIDPGSARTAEDFVMLLRQARAMSEQTYWQLQERAKAAGHELEPSILVESLGLAELPDERLVSSLLHACGYSEEEIGEWLEVHSRLSSSTPMQLRRGAAASSSSVSSPVSPSVSSPVSSPVSSSVLTAEVPATAVHETAPRPRHTLRIRGKGSRRAPGSQLRLLAMALGAAVIGIVSIVIIVSAVKDDDVTGNPPIYATGAAPPTAEPGLPYPTSDPSVPPSPTPAFSTPATPTPSASATPAPGVLRSGTATLQTGQSIDLDAGGSDPDIVVYGNGDSIRADPSGRHFALVATASKQACAASNDYQKTMGGLVAGNGVCVRTDKGLYAHITISRTAPLVFSYVVWS